MKSFIKNLFWLIIGSVIIAAALLVGSMHLGDGYITAGCAIDGNQQVVSCVIQYTSCIVQWNDGFNLDCYTVED